MLHQQRSGRADRGALPDDRCRHTRSFPGENLAPFYEPNWRQAIRLMVDTRTPEQRRRIMQSIGTRNTGPEMAVRRLLHRLGYRYRLHRRDLPGSPDIVFPSRRAAVFVHGCYWHGHGCAKGRLPKSRLDYWGPKIRVNRKRDSERQKALRRLGWRVLVLWQCEIRDRKSLIARVTQFLGANAKIRSTY